MSRPRILHVSSAHPPTDPRIAYRVLPALADDYDLTALLPSVLPGRRGGIRYGSLPMRDTVLGRVLVSYPRVFGWALRRRPRLLHIYDPELLPLARLLQRLLRIPVVYEVHENLHKKLPATAQNQGLISVWLFRYFDALARRHFHLILTEHGYRNTYRDLTKPSAVIYNYPNLPFLEPYRFAYAPSRDKPEFFLIGWVSLDYAFDTLVAALALLKVRYPDFIVHLFGRRTLSERDCQKLPGYAAVRDNLRFYGYTNQPVALPYAARATAGLALPKPVGDFPESYTTKLFEYMALGLPVVTSDFELYRNVVETYRCGLCVSPLDAAAVADALTYLIEHPDEACTMGGRGRQAVENRYNWEGEANTLRRYYKQILNSG